MFEFLTELRASSEQGPVRLNDVSHATAHLLADHIIGVAAQGWQSCKDTAHRSRTDPRYLYATSASELFFKVNMQNLPKPNDLMGLLHLERAAAMKALRDGQEPQQTDAASGVNIRTGTVNVQGQSVSSAGVGAGRRSAGGHRRRKPRHEAGRPAEVGAETGLNSPVHEDS